MIQWAYQSEMSMKYWINLWTIRISDHWQFLEKRSYFVLFVPHLQVEAMSTWMCILSVRAITYEALRHRATCNSKWQHYVQINTPKANCKLVSALASTRSWRDRNSSHASSKSIPFPWSTHVAQSSVHTLFSALSLSSLMDSLKLNCGKYFLTRASVMLMLSCMYILPMHSSDLLWRTMACNRWCYSTSMNQSRQDVWGAISRETSRKNSESYSPWDGFYIK